MKIILVTTCKDCPYYCSDPKYRSCQRHKRDFSKAASRIPAWCKLTDREDM